MVQQPTHIVTNPADVANGRRPFALFRIAGSMGILIACVVQRFFGLHRREIAIVAPHSGR